MRTMPPQTPQPRPLVSGAVDLLIVRHARPLRQEVGGGEGTADPELSGIGRAQARRTADFLAGEGVDHIVSSTMVRARQTAEPLAAALGLEVQLQDDLRESDHRSQVYVPVEEMDPGDPATAHYFGDDLRGALFPDGYDGFAERVRGAFEAIIEANRSRTVVVFCHGMVTVVFLQGLLGFNDVLQLRPDYCGITRVLASSSGVRTVKSVNETYHVRDLFSG